MQLENERKALELQQREVKQTADLALQELKIRLDANNDDKKTKTDQTRMIMDALEKINKIATRGME